MWKENSPDNRRKVENRGNQKKICMSKVQNFAGLSQSLPFTEFDFYESYRLAFEKSEFGRMKRLLPLHEMAESFGLVSKNLRPKRVRKKETEILVSIKANFLGNNPHLIRILFVILQRDVTHKYLQKL